MKRLEYSVAALALTLAGVASGCTSAGSSPAGSGATAPSTTGASAAALGNIAIWSSLPLQGSAKGQTDQMVKAIRFAIDEREGLVAGYSVAYEPQDDATAEAGAWTEAKEIDAATRAANDPTVVAYIGPMNSGAAKVSIPILCRAGLTMVSPGTTYPGLTKPGKGEPGEPGKYYPGCERDFFMVQATDDLQGLAGAKFAAQLGFHSAFIIDDGSIYGRGIADVFAQEAPAQGVTVTGSVSIRGLETDYKALAARISSVKPDVVYFGGVTQSNAGQLWRDIRAAAPEQSMMAPDGIYEQAFLDAAGPAGEGTYMTFAGLPADQLPPRGQQFGSAFKAKYGLDSIEANAVLAYDAANVALDAIARAAARNPTSLTELRRLVLEETRATRDFEGALGTWGFDENGNTTLTDMSGYQVKDGAFLFTKVIR